MQESFRLKVGDGKAIHVYRWLPEVQPRAVIQIAHGMGEHAARYDWTARQLNAAGYAVYANDHRGHGETADPDRLGWMGEDGWNRVIADAADLTDHIRATHPEAPVVLLGHSMGAMLSQQYLYRCGAKLDAAVLSGSPGVAGRFQAWLSRTIARFERWRLGADAESALLQKLLRGKEPPENVTFFRGRGCKKCLGTGYSGRTPIFEIMVVTPKLADAIENGLPTSRLREIALSEGMSELVSSGLDKAISGKTTLEEVYYKTSG